MKNKPRTILIVDDNVVNLKVAVSYLKAYSFEILTARHGEAGIERAKLAQPDLILLDVQMPGIDGLETCRRLQENPQTAVIPIIFMTVLNDSDSKVKGLEVGAVDFVTKPIDAAELLARINIHMQLRSYQEQLQERNTGLEEEVGRQTAVLQEEITRSHEHQSEKIALLKLVQQQSQQMRQLTTLYLQSESQRHSKAYSAYQQVAQDLTLLETHLHHAQQLVADLDESTQAATLINDHLQSAVAILDHAHIQSQNVGSNLAETVSAQEKLQANPLLSLSEREYEVFQLLTTGKSNTEISELLFVAKTTVSTHRRRIIDKLNVEDLPGLVKVALQYDLIS